MAKAYQLYSILNTVAKQIFGESTIEVVDTASMVSLGNEVLSTDKNTDAFTGAISDLIGRTITSVRNYNPRKTRAVMHPFTYGVALRKLYVDLPDTQSNESWEIGQEMYEPKFAPVYKPSVKQKIFSIVTTFEIAVTIPDNILATAFHNEVDMAVLISAIFTAQNNRMEIALENLLQLTRAAFMARKLIGMTDHPCGAINLLSMFKKDYPEKAETITAANCLYDKDFLRFFAMTLKLYSDYMETMSVAFNNDEGYKRHTPKNLQEIGVLSYVDSRLTGVLQSDTYHDELVKLTGYHTVPYWQGSGKEFKLEDVSKISIKLTGEENGGNKVEQSGILAVMYDWEAIGVTLDMRRETSERNNHAEYTNYYRKSTAGYFNDMSENGIVFFVDDNDKPNYATVKMTNPVKVAKTK